MSTRYFDRTMMNLAQVYDAYLHVFDEFWQVYEALPWSHMKTKTHRMIFTSRLIFIRSSLGNTYEMLSDMT
jgi:hypothetical protein